LHEYAGLAKFWELFNLAISISPCEERQIKKYIAYMPTVSMIAEIGNDFDMDMDSKTFWFCVSKSLARVRENVRTKANHGA
jgi:hypothetical protein